MPDADVGEMDRRSSDWERPLLWVLELAEAESRLILPTTTDPTCS